MGPRERTWPGRTRPRRDLLPGGRGGARRRVDQRGAAPRRSGRGRALPGGAGADRRGALAGRGERAARPRPEARPLLTLRRAGVLGCGLGAARGGRLSTAGIGASHRRDVERRRDADVAVALGLRVSHRGALAADRLTDLRQSASGCSSAPTRTFLSYWSPQSAADHRDELLEDWTLPDPVTETHGASHSSVSKDKRRSVTPTRPRRRGWGRRSGGRRPSRTAPPCASPRRRTCRRN